MNNPVKNPAYSLICGIAALGILAAASNLPAVMHPQKNTPSVIPAPTVIPAPPEFQPLKIQRPPQSLPQRTAEVLGLSDCQVVRLILPNAVERALAENRELPAFTLTIPIRGQQCTLELWPHSVRSPEYFEVKAQQADGSWVVHDPGPVRTVRGMVVDGNGIPMEIPGEGGLKVAGSVGGEGFRGLILMPDQSEVWIEPLGDRVPGAKPTDYVVYEGSAVMDRGFECAVSEQPTKQKRVNQEPLPAPLVGPVDNTLYCAEIAYDVDFEMSAFYNHDIDIMLASAEATTNMMNLQYEHQVHITHFITTVLIRTSEPDPYDNPANMADLMSQFVAEWRNNQTHIPRDVTMLFTLNDNASGGSAIIASVCDLSRGYCIVRGFGIPLDADDVAREKHELGHTWGAFHCSCPGHTMNGGNHHLLGFSQETIDTIVAYRNSVDCLDICGTVETGSTPLPFLDDFEGPVIDPTRWIGIEGTATVSDLGNNEPSGSHSLHISGNSEVRTAFMNTIGPWGFEVRYHWQPGGLGVPPGPDDELIIEYLAPNFDWIPIGEHVGDGSSNSSFQLFSTILNFAGQFGSEMFRIRIRGISPVGGGDWFVDNMEVIPIQYNPCPDDCAPGFNGIVDIADLIIVVAAVNGQNLGGNTDVTPRFPDGSFGNGVVNIDDIVSILLNWGPCE